MTDLAKLVVRLEAQSAQLLSVLEKANKKIDRFASATSKTLSKWAGGLLGFFSGRALFNFSKQVLQTQGELVGMAERAGTTVDRLSGLGFAAEQSASSLEGLQKGLGNLADRAADASEKGGAAGEAFAKLGVNVEKSDGSLKNSADLLLEIADQFAQYEDGAAKSALATDLFGKQGKELIPLLNRGAAGIEELRKKADELGITIGQDAAEAANTFNDQLNTLGGIARGVVGRALQEVLPILTGFNEELINGEDAAGRADKAARVLATGLKLLLSAGVIVGEIFDRVGDTLGATAAALVALAQGEFSQAWSIIKDGAQQTADSGAQAADDLFKVWDSNAQAIAKSAEDADARVKKTLIGGGGGDAVQEVKISAQKIERNAVEQFYEDLDEMTKTSSELAQTEYEKQKAALEELYAAGRISLEQYNERVGEAFDKFLPEFEVTVDKIKETSKKAADDIDEFTKQAARNTQDILAGGLKTALHDGIDEGADGALKAFGDMLEEMALQAIAKNVAQYIFGEPGKEGDTGGLIGSLASSFFAGSRDSGGRGRPGFAYAIGSGAQPEMYVPDEPGTFVPRDQWMAGGGPTLGKLEQNIYVQGKADMRTARQMSIEANRRQRIAATRLG